MIGVDEELVKKMSIEDLERINAYGKELAMGLRMVRSFPQGVTIFGSARLPQDNKYCQLAYKLGGELAKNGHAVITGGGPGIMEAASHGAYEIGGRTIGFNITLSHEQFPNPYLTECITFDYFFARKVSLAMAAKVFAFFPGGYGTMDEIGEILCLMQENKMPKMPMFLIGKTYWKSFDKVIKTMIEMKLIGEHDMDIFTITDDVNEVVKAANKIGFKEASAIK